MQEDNKNAVMNLYIRSQNNSSFRKKWRNHKNFAHPFQCAQWIKSVQPLSTKWNKYVYKRDKNAALEAIADWQGEPQ